MFLLTFFAYFLALTLQLASFEKFASSFTPPSFKFSENFNSLFILLITLFLVNTFVETSRNSSEYAQSLLFFLYIFPLFFGIIIHVDSVKKACPLLRACLFTYFTVYEPCSIQLYIYFSSSVSCACFTIRSGRNVSIITANSSVSFFPILASVFPGCGPWGIPLG